MNTYNAPTMPRTAATKWEAKGYAGSGNVAELIGTGSGPALVVGTAHQWRIDVHEAQHYYGHDAVVFAVNEAGMFLPRVDHFVSLHYDRLLRWDLVRDLYRERYPAHITKLHSYGPLDKGNVIDYNWYGLSPLMALSGDFAMQIAFLMGYAPIVLCGCPHDSSPRFYDMWPRRDFNYGGGSSQQDANVREQLVREMERVPEFRAAVRGMSGWARSFFTSGTQGA